MNVIIAYQSLLTISLSDDSNDSQSHRKHERLMITDRAHVTEILLSIIIVLPLLSYLDGSKHPQSHLLAAFIRCCKTLALGEPQQSC